MKLYILQSLVIIVVFLSLYYFLLKRETHFQFNRFFLIGGLILGLLLPLLPLNFNSENINYLYIPKADFESHSTDSSTPNEGFLWNVENVLIGLYFVGLIISFIVSLVTISSVLSIIKKGKLVVEDGIQKIITQENIAPFSFFNYIVLSQKHVEDAGIREIIIHEKVHINQWHQLDLVFSEIIKNIVWFFPPIWWYVRFMRENLEYIADEVSLDNGIDSKQYQLHLVRLSQSARGPEMVNHFSKKLIKNRIIMMNKQKLSERIPFTKWGVLGMALVCSIGITLKAQDQPKVKTVIVLTDDDSVPLKSEDVKVMVKNEQGTFEEVQPDHVDIIQENQSGVHRFEKVIKGTDENGKDIEKSLLIIEDSNKNIDDKIKELESNVDNFKMRIKDEIDGDVVFTATKNIFRIENDSIQMDFSFSDFDNISKEFSDEDIVHKLKSIEFREKAKNMGHIDIKDYQSMENAIIIIDGKKSNQDKLHSLNNEDIKSISIIKGDTQKIKDKYLKNNKIKGLSTKEIEKAEGIIEIITK